MANSLQCPSKQRCKTFSPTWGSGQHIRAPLTIHMAFFMLLEALLTAQLHISPGPQHGVKSRVPGECSQSNNLCDPALPFSPLTQHSQNSASQALAGLPGTHAYQSCLTFGNLQIILDLQWGCVQINPSQVESIIS